jgi:5'-nucleotidase
MREPRVLVTNDDGVDAPGLAALAAAASGHGFDVVVAAPLREASGMSAALTAVTDDGRVLLERREFDELPGVPVFAVAASPAYLAVLAGLGVFGPPPQIVLSGINRGANAGHAILHSGTVGAALTALQNGARAAMAVSLDVLPEERAGDDVRHWAAAATLARTLFAGLAEAPPGTLLNLNVPDRPEPAGLREASLAPFGQVQMAVAERGDGFVRTGIERSGEHAPGSDIALLAEGYATITAIRPIAEAAGVSVPAQRPAPRDAIRRG